MKTIQASFTSGELAPSLYGRSDLARYASGCKTLKNMFVHAHGGASNRAGTRYIGTSSGMARLIPFQFSITQAYVLELTNLKMRVIKDGGLVEDPSTSTVVEFTTPWLESELFDLRFTQSADVLYIVHPDHDPTEVTRTDHHIWTVTTMTYSPVMTAPTGLSATFTDSATYRELFYKVTAVDAGGNESLPSADASNFTPPIWEDGRTMDLSWTAVADAVHYNVYKSTNGGTSYGWIGLAEDATTFKDDNITPESNDGPPGAKDPFNGTDNKPGAVSIFQQRMIYGRSNKSPQTVWTSKTGSLSDMSTSTPLKDDDAITATMASRQMNEIMHFVPLKQLIVLTSGAEWLLKHGSNSDALTPTSIQFEIQSYNGASKVPPLVIGDSVLFIQRNGKVVRNLAYALENDGFSGNNLSVLSGHLFKDVEIIDWAHQQTPYGVIWCIRDDGVMLGFTYLREHEVWAWTHHETQGEYKSICSIPGSEKDEVYLSVKRTINGSDVYYLEHMQERITDNDIKNAFFVDCGLSLDSPLVITNTTQANPVVVTSNAHGLSNGDLVDISNIVGMTELNGERFKVSSATTNTFELQDQNTGIDIDGTSYTAYKSGGEAREAVSTISGLSHLEGESVIALADGSVAENLTVSSGAVTLPYPASIVHIGLSYESVIETLRLNIPVQSGTIQGIKKKISSVTIRMDKTRAFKIGATSDDLIEMKLRSSENYGSPTAMYTGDKEVPIIPDWNRDGQLYIKQTQPLPMTILALIPEVDFGS